MAKFYNFLVLLFGLVPGSISHTRQLDPEIEEKINTYIHNVYLPAAGVSTLALTIVQNDGETLYTNGYGWANEEKQIPNTNDTLFIIASCSKSFTAVALLKALNEKFPEMGEAVLDTPIRKLVPEYNFTLIDRFRSEHGTIRDILGHRMCLPRTDWPLDAGAIETTAEISYRQRYNEEICGMRTALQYQNQMYGIAGEILSLLTNKPFEESVEDLMKEIGMEKTRFTRTSDDFANTPEIARPYYVDIFTGELVPINPLLPLRIVPSNAGGGALSTANEMSRYLRFHANHGNLDGKQIVPEEVMKWTRKPAIHNEPVQYAFAYGQALFLSQYRGWEYIHHGGDFSPYHSLMSWFPAQNLSIFTSTNQGPLKVDRTVLHTFIWEVMNGAEDAEARAKQVWDELELKEKANKKDQGEAVRDFVNKSIALGGHVPKRAEELVGEYGSGAAGDAEIIEKWNNATNEIGLYLKYGVWATGFLEHVEGPVYLLKIDTDLEQNLAGLKDALFVRVIDDTIEFLLIQFGQESSFGKFQLGVSLANLPPIPWLPDSCRAE